MGKIDSNKTPPTSYQKLRFRKEAEWKPLYFLYQKIFRLLQIIDSISRDTWNKDNLHYSMF